MAQKFATQIEMLGNRITGVASPLAVSDAATKQYVDSVAAGLDIHPSVRAATTGNITLSGLQTIDGVLLIEGNRVLVKDQTNAAQNGIWIAASGAWQRAEDANEDAEVSAGLFVFVEEGTVNADSGRVLSTDNPIVLDTTLLTFTQFSGAGQIAAGNGLTKVGSTLDVGGGTGISVGADDISIDPAVVPRKHAVDVGDGALTQFTITHNFNTRDVLVQIREAASPYAFVIADVEADTVNSVIIRFASAPTAGQYRVMVHG